MEIPFLLGKRINLRVTGGSVSSSSFSKGEKTTSGDAAELPDEAAELPDEAALLELSACEDEEEEEEEDIIWTLNIHQLFVFSVIEDAWMF